MRFVIALPEDLLADLNARAREERAREQDWLSSARDRALVGAHSGRERARALTDVRAEHARLRDAGRLLGSRDLLIAHQVRQLLRERGWDHEWPAPPPGAASTPGRRWGVSPHDARGGEARLSIQLPDHLGELVRRAAYWTSANAVRELIDWQDEYGPGIGAALGEAEAGNPIAGLMLLAAALGRRPSAEAMDARRRARSKIVTAGDILRQAALLAIDAKPA